MNVSKVAALGVFLITFIWGIEFVLIHNAIEFLDPHSFNAVRFGIAALFIALCTVVKKKFKGFNKDIILNGCFLGLLLYLGFTFQTMGLLYTTVSNCGFITSLSVILVPLIALILLKEPFQLLTGVGIGGAATGLYLLTASGETPFNYGDLLTLIGAIGFALHIIYTGKLGRKHEILKLTLIQLSTVSILSLGSVLAFEGVNGLPHLSVMGKPIVMVAILIAAILGTGIALMIQTFAQSHLTSTRVALIFTMEPVFAALTAFLVLNESLSDVAGLGALMIIGGIIISEIPTGKQKKRALCDE
ncbi:MAG: DMT family transporter [Bacteroidales bacterium]|nr:DMT family transporter [Bacteroidales bacterium]